jgi:hypothetical protein
MILRMRWPFFAMAIVLLLIFGGGILAHYTGYFNLHRIKIEPDKYADEAAGISCTIGKNIFTTSFTEMLACFIADQRVQSAHLDYELPDAISINISEAQPLALAIARDGQSIYALDERGRAMPYEQPTGAFKLPIITGLKDCPYYRRPDDLRLRLIIPQLLQIREDNEDFYRSISSIDLSAHDTVTVKMDGVPFPLIMFAGKMYENFGRLRQFLLDINPDLKDVVLLDLRSEKQIIATRRKCQKQG